MQTYDSAYSLIVVHYDLALVYRRYRFEGYENSYTVKASGAVRKDSRITGRG